MTKTTHCDVNPRTLNSNDSSNNNNQLQRNNAPRAVTISSEQNSDEPPYQLRVLGIADEGAKSRVETQIRLELQLLDNQGNRLHQWSHIRLASYLLTLKRRNASTSTLITTTATRIPNRKKPAHALDRHEPQQQALSIPEESMLYLDASVICESDSHRKVKMCRRCVWREWKRADRKKTARQLGNDRVYDEALLEKERHRILLFNSEPILAFDQGECVLPTRITCYSRHHDERKGFRIKFMIHDYQGHLMATGTSAPIMITDDHKNLSKLGDKGRRRKTTTKSSKSSLPPSPPCLPSPEEDTSPTFDESNFLLATRASEEHDVLPSPGSTAIGSLNTNYEDVAMPTVESKNDPSYLLDPNGYLFSPSMFTSTSSLWSGSISPTDIGSPVSSSPSSPTSVSVYSLYEQQQHPQPTTGEWMHSAQASMDSSADTTLLNSDLYEGMTWDFGDQRALTMTNWNPTTLPAEWNNSSLTWQQLLSNDHGTLDVSQL